MPLLREKCKIEGMTPERALLRLKRSGISLYNVRKTQKDAILFEVKKKDIQKVFAIYPNVCYNSITHSAYKASSLGGVGLAKWVDFCKNRTGFLLGALAFAALTLFSEPLVMGVEVVGATAYTREAMQALEENGIRPYAFYPEKREEEVAASLLGVKGVEFCSVQKIGRWVRVEIRTSPLTTDYLQKDSMIARHTGTIVAQTVLRGFALKKVGDTVTAGELLVGNWFSTEEGGQVRVEPIARVRIACTYEGAHEAETETEAFAQAYLSLGLTDGEIVGRSVTRTESGFHVKLDYCVTERVNF